MYLNNLVFDSEGPSQIICVLVQDSDLAQEQGAKSLSIGGAWKRFDDGAHGSLQGWVDVFIVSLVSKDMAEEQNSSSEDGSWICGLEGVFTELNNLLAVRRLSDKISTRLGLIYVSKHFQGDQMVIMDNFVVSVCYVNAE